MNWANAYIWLWELFLFSPYSQNCAIFYRSKDQLRPTPPANNRQTAEDKTVIIFLFITLVFIICHSPRMILDINELFNLKNTNDCYAKNMPHVHLWIFIMMHVSHFCLVLNASLNMVVYGFLCPSFQKEFKSIFSRKVNN